MMQQQFDDKRGYDGATRPVVPPPHGASRLGGQTQRNYMPQSPQFPQPPQQGNGMGIAGFVLSIVSVFFCFVPVVGGLCWILAIVFSAIGLGRRPRGLAIAGFIVSLAFPLLMVAIAVGIFAIASIGELQGWLWAF